MEVKSIGRVNFQNLNCYEITILFAKALASPSISEINTAKWNKLLRKFGVDIILDFGTGII